MALAERPTLTPEEREAVLGRLLAKYDGEPSDHVVQRSPDDDRIWHSLGIELEEEPTDDVAAAGVAVLAKFFELLERRRPAWQRDALCIEYVDTVTWFPAPGESTASAKDICARCLVRDECESYAVEIDAPAGIWAGTSARSRKRDAA